MGWVRVWVVLSVLLVAWASGYKWTLIPQQSGTPSPRFDFGYGYNNNTKKYFVFGGQDESGTLGDFYGLSIDTNTWKTLPSGPTARRDAGAVVCNNLFYLIGGQNSSTYYGDMWSYSEVSNAWNFIGYFPNMQLSGGSLTCGSQQQLTYFGGRTPNNVYSNETYVYNEVAKTWTSLGVYGPSGRMYMTIVYTQSQYVVFGGYPGALPSLDDMWMLSNPPNPVWTNLASTNSWPAGRSGQAMVYDPVNSQIIMYGGENVTGGGMGDLWYFSLNTNSWTQIFPPNMPGNLLGAGIALTDYNMIVFGGVTGWTPSDSVVNELWILANDVRALRVELLMLSCIVLFSVIFVI